MASGYGWSVMSYLCLLWLIQPITAQHSLPSDSDQQRSSQEAATLSIHCCWSSAPSPAAHTLTPPTLEVPTNGVAELPISVDSNLLLLNFSIYSVRTSS